MGQRIRILIADDHTIVRSGVRLLLENESDIEVVGELGAHFRHLHRLIDERVAQTERGRAQCKPLAATSDTDPALLIVARGYESDRACGASNVIPVFVVLAAGRDRVQRRGSAAPREADRARQQARGRHRRARPVASRRGSHAARAL